MTPRPDPAPAAAPVVVNGTPAASGFAHGPLHVLDVAVGHRPGPAGDAGGETAQLRIALDLAARDLEALVSGTPDPDARALLEFQMALLDDDAIVGPAFAAIAAGAAADAAWRGVLDEQVRDYQATPDAYFAARAADLADLRDRVLRCLTGTAAAPVPTGAIVVAADLPPSRFLEIEWRGGGIALFGGSAQSHTATLARARGIPMIVAMGRAALPAGDGLLDADAGVLVAAPDRVRLEAFVQRRAAAEAVRAGYERYAAAPGATADGERVHVLLNVADAGDLRSTPSQHCDGIGLVRTELLLHAAADLSDEKRQYERYRAILAWAGDRPVTFRTLDAGGDKPIAGYTLEGEANPFLGVRGVRLSLRRPEILRIQLRALARAAAGANAAIMVPMVTQPGELERVRALLDAAVSELQAAGVACRRPPLGMMIEVPAAALALDTFDSDFFSIGSNDLIAYLCAAGRDSDEFAGLTDPLQPAVLRLIRQVVTDARALGREISLCGDMAADPRCIPALLGAGLRRFSVAPARLAHVKSIIAEFSAAAVG